METPRKRSGDVVASQIAENAAQHPADSNLNGIHRYLVNHAAPYTVHTQILPLPTVHRSKDGVTVVKSGQHYLSATAIVAAARFEGAPFT